MRVDVALLACAVLALTAAPGCGGETESEVYGLIWQDEFAGPAGQLPDPAKWQFDVGTDWGNLQLEYDTNRAENCSLDGHGNLAITARQEEWLGQAYTSARIKTKGLFERAYGRFEARIKLPVGRGIWPAFWMLGSDFPGVSWPDCGEIDVMEYRGQEPRVLVGSVHGPGYAGNGALSQTHTLAQGGFHLDYHLFAIDWDASSITWSVDGYVFHRITAADLPAGARWVFDHPFFILLNVAVGGRWVGSPDVSTVFPQAMLVDYVRVYGIQP